MLFDLFSIMIAINNALLLSEITPRRSCSSSLNGTLHFFVVQLLQSCYFSKLLAVPLGVVILLNTGWSVGRLTLGSGWNQFKWVGLAGNGECGGCRKLKTIHHCSISALGVLLCFALDLVRTLQGKPISSFRTTKGSTLRAVRSVWAESFVSRSSSCLASVELSSESAFISRVSVLFPANGHACSLSIFR